MVRVAVEAVQHSDMDALERGLAKLYQADPAVEVLVQVGPPLGLIYDEIHI